MPPERSRLHAALAVTVSGLSLAALVFFATGGTAEAGELVVITEQGWAAAETRAEPLAEPLAAASEPSGPADQTLVAPATVSPTPVAHDHDDDHDDHDDHVMGEMIAAPDVAGERLWVARKHFREAGLIFAPREDGRVVPTDAYGMFQVPDDYEAGRKYAKGTKVEVEVDYFAFKGAGGY